MKDLEKAWAEYAEKMHDRPIHEIQSPVNFVHYLLEKDHLPSGLFSQVLIVQAVLDLILVVAVAWLLTR